MRFRTIGILAVACILVSSAPASAVTIFGQLANSASGPDNDPAHGGGNIQAVFEAAAAQWELAILDPLTVTIDYGWSPPPGPLGFSFGDTVSGVIGVPIHHPWFVDATPNASEEYTVPESVGTTLNGIAVNYAIGFTGGTGAATGYDLFTVLLHEIGHILSAGPGLISNTVPDGHMDINAPLPLAGLSIPSHQCCHVDVPAGYTGLNPLMFPFTDIGERRFISNADLLYVAQGGGWTQLDQTRFEAPEPGVIVLLGVGLLAVSRRRHARRRG